MGTATKWQLLAAGATFALGCNAILGIEEKPLKPGSDAGAGDAAARRAPDKCSADSECVPPNDCYTGHCDTALGSCTYTLCEPKGRTCAAAACDPAKFTCGEPRDYSMRVTSYSVTGVALGCHSADLCVSAAFPYVFLGTKDDVVALRADDLLATAPTRVAIEQVTIRPAQLVASGRRVWILGTPQGTSPPYQLSIAWIDVPSDPTLQRLVGKTATVSYPFASATGFPAPDGGLYVVYNELAEGFPAAVLKPPLETGASMAVVNPADAGAPSPPPAIPLVRVPSPPATSTIVASSGARLVAYRGPGIVNAIEPGGTQGAAVGDDVALTPAYSSFGLPRFASSASGVVLMTSAIRADAPAPDCGCTSRQHMSWVLPSAAGASEPSQAADYETYQSPQAPGGACRQCNPPYMTSPGQITPIDRRTALAAAPASENRAFTAVRTILRDPLATPNKRRFVTSAADDPQGNVETDRIALTSSNGFGYLVLADGQGNKVTLSIIDPRCDAQ